MAANVMSTVRKQKTGQVFLCSPHFLLLMQSGIPAHLTEMPKFRAGVLTSINLIQIIPQSHAQKFVSIVILNPVKLAVRIKHHRWVLDLQYMLGKIWGPATVGTFLGSQRIVTILSQAFCFPILEPNTKPSIQWELRIRRILNLEREIMFSLVLSRIEFSMRFRFKKKKTCGPE